MGPDRAGRMAAAAGTALAADHTDPVDRGRAAAVGVPPKAGRTAAAADRRVRAVSVRVAAARTDWLGSARMAAAARSCSCRQDIGPTRLSRPSPPASIREHQVATYPACWAAVVSRARTATADRESEPRFHVGCARSAHVATYAERVKAT